MKAAVCIQQNEPLQIKEVTTPVPQKGEVLVQIKAAALNHRDVWIQQGMYAGLRYPIILGSDASGIVAAIGEGVDDTYLHQEVIINPGMHWGNHPATHSRDFTILGLPKDGTLAEYVTVPVTNIVPKPTYLSWEAAAAIPLAGLTGYRALFTKGNISSGMNVLITGIGGGVAMLMLQMAVAIGAKVYVTSGSDEKIQQAVAMGAQLGVNYHISGWHKLFQSAVEGFDVIVDSAAGEGFKHFIDLANPGGKIVFFGGTQGPITTLNPQKIFWKQLSILGTTMGSEAEFGAMIALFEQYRIQPVVHKVYPLADINTAFDTMRAGQQTGKLVIRM